MMRTPIAGGCLALLGSFTTASELPARLSYAAAPISALVSRRELPFLVATAARDGEQITVLAHRVGVDSPKPVAWFTETVHRGKRYVSIRKVAATGVPPVTVYEHLYALTMRQDPHAQFCFSEAAGTCDASRGGQSHNATLLAIAAARQRSVVEAGQPGSGAPVWRSISFRPARTGKDLDVVAIFAFDGEQPLQNASVFFNRAPHSSCAAKTTRAGLATCRLVDQHGDHHDPAVEQATPVLAVYPGDLGQRELRLPTTHVIPPRR